MTDLWQPQPTCVVSLKVALEHFVECLESEERMVGASRVCYGGAGGGDLKAFSCDLTMLVRCRKAAGRKGALGAKRSQE